MMVHGRQLRPLAASHRCAGAPSVQERGETIGDTVGYSIRLESKGGPHSSIMFCTNGVLLRMLTQGEGLQVCTCTCTCSVPGVVCCP